MRAEATRPLVSILLPPAFCLAAACAGGLSGSQEVVVPTPAEAGQDKDATAPGGDAAAVPAGDAPATGVTYHRTIAPLLAAHCNGCHKPDGIAPFSLTTYDDANKWRKAIVYQTSSKKMPPWGTQESPECKPRYPWQDDVRLSDAEIETLRTWEATGAPQGDPKDAMALPPAPGAQLSQVDLEVKPAKPYTASGAKDQFRCFVMDPKLGQDRVLAAAHVIPQNPRIVHHVEIAIDPTRKAAAFVEPSGSYDCFSTNHVPESYNILIWTPGALPFEFPAHTGIRVPRDSLMIMKIHYHTHGSVPAEPDATRFQARFSMEAPRYEVHASQAIGNDDKRLPDGTGLLPDADDGAGGATFNVPANATAHVETMLEVVPGSTRPSFIFGMIPHMHYVGRDIKAEIQRQDTSGGQPKNECLVHVPSWDFNWQRHYAYDTPVDSLPLWRPGDKIKVTCTYDNTTNNPFVRESLAQQGLKAPIDVKLGETTLDEMCLVLFTLIEKI